ATWTFPSCIRGPADLPAAATAVPPRACRGATRSAWPSSKGGWRSSRWCRPASAFAACSSVLWPQASLFSGVEVIRSPSTEQLYHTRLPDYRKENFTNYLENQLTRSYNVLISERRCHWQRNGPRDARTSGGLATT